MQPVRAVILQQTGKEGVSVPSTTTDGRTQTKTVTQSPANEFHLDKSGLDPNMPGHSSEHNMIMRQEPRTVKTIGA